MRRSTNCRPPITTNASLASKASQSARRQASIRPHPPIRLPPKAPFTPDGRGLFRACDARKPARQGEHSGATQGVRVGSAHRIDCGGGEVLIMDCHVAYAPRNDEEWGACDSIGQPSAVPPLLPNQTHSVPSCLRVTIFHPTASPITAVAIKANPVPWLPRRLRLLAMTRGRWRWLGPSSTLLHHPASYGLPTSQTPPLVIASEAKQSRA